MGTFQSKNDAYKSAQIGARVVEVAIDFVKNKKGDGQNHHCLSWMEGVMKAALPPEELKENAAHWNLPNGSAAKTALSMKKAGMMCSYSDIGSAGLRDLQIKKSESKFRLSKLRYGYCQIQ